MERERLESSLEGIRQLLSCLHGEVTHLEENYSQVLLVLRKLEGVCEIDDLTGLMRRKSFFQKWTSLLEACEKLNENAGVLLIDIDKFKKINDTHGHPAGDEVLKRVASLLKTYESPDLAVGRYGGEEFTVALKGTEAEILGVAESIRKSVERIEGPIPCTLSIGVAVSDRHGFDQEKLLEAADQALYESKNSGRNQVSAA